MKKRKSLMIPAILLLCLFFISGCGEGVPAGTLNTTGATVTLTSNAPVRRAFGGAELHPHGDCCRTIPKPATRPRGCAPPRPSPCPAR